MSTNTSLVDSLSNGIAQMENANPSLNNPGNIMDLSYYQSTGQFKLASYPTLAAGWAALKSLVSSYIGQGLTLEQFTAKYAPAGHGNNDPGNYANFLSAQTGIPTNIPLNTVDPSMGSDPSVDASFFGQSASTDTSGSTSGDVNTSPLLAGFDLSQDVSGYPLWVWLGLGATILVYLRNR